MLAKHNAPPLDVVHKPESCKVDIRCERTFLYATRDGFRERLEIAPPAMLFFAASALELEVEALQYPSPRRANSVPSVVTRQFATPSKRMEAAAQAVDQTIVSFPKGIRFTNRGACHPIGPVDGERPKSRYGLEVAGKRTLSTGRSRLITLLYWRLDHAQPMLSAWDTETISHVLQIPFTAPFTSMHARATRVLHPLRVRVKIGAWARAAEEPMIAEDSGRLFRTALNFQSDRDYAAPIETHVECTTPEFYVHHDVNARKRKRHRALD